MMLPNFLVIGPPRTGTTWLFRQLQKHPDIFVPEVKQVHFFDKEYTRGVRWYEQFFSKANPKKQVIGELTPDYISHPKAAMRIYETLGKEIKLIIIIREPVERALSEYKMKQRASKQRKSFLTALKEDKSLVKNGLYSKNIKRFIDVFPKSSLEFMDYNFLVSDPDDFLKQIQKHLGVRQIENLNSEKGHINNSLPRARIIFLERMIKSLRKMIENLPYGHRVAWAIRKMGLVELTHRLNSTNNILNVENWQKKEAYKYFAEDWLELSEIAPEIYNKSNY